MRARTALRMVVLVGAVCLMMSCASTDVGITAKVKAKIAADNALNAFQIQVETKDKVVTLTGNIDSEEAKNAALEVARNTKGVVDVVDMISVKTASHSGDAPEPNRSLGATIDDAGITVRVKTRLLEDPSVNGSRIDVDTRNGIVFLTGSVDSKAQKEKAIQLAKETEGVADVRANLTVGQG